MKEEWKKVLGYEGLYVVSNFGRIIGLSMGRFNNPYKIKLGYLGIHLCKKGKSKNFLMHRLIAQAFIPNPFNKPHINHINGVKTDNSIKNLEWCTASENERHSRDFGLNPNIGQTHHQAKLKEEDIYKIRSLYKQGELLKNIACLFGITKTHACKIGKHKAWTHI